LAIITLEATRQGRSVDEKANEKSIYTRTLERAAEILGDEEVLAAFLGISWTELRRWLSGKEAPTQDAFLRSVDILNNEQRILLARLKVADERDRLIGRFRKVG
jgi:hypothetical protein